MELDDENMSMSTLKLKGLINKDLVMLRIPAGDHLTTVSGEAEPSSYGMVP